MREYGPTSCGSTQGPVIDSRCAGNELSGSMKGPTERLSESKERLLDGINYMHRERYDLTILQ